MAYKTDGGGFAFKCGDCKIGGDSSTWAMKLSQLAKQKGTVRILTYSLPDMDYVRTQLGRRPSGIWLVAHSKFWLRAHEIKREFPDIRVAVHHQMHSKILLIEPGTIYISSANFGLSGWHETGIGLHSVPAHDWYKTHVFDATWKESEEIEGAVS